MRTLKKTLCLVLCLAMMAGLCAFGASAKVFTDVADIENKEAVDLLVGLGIIEGYEDGSFNPTKILTRAEASKIIAYLLLGKTAADALPLADTKFEDVTAAHWASGFIGYCVSQGIVAGVSDTAFDPSAPLTDGAWSKMLLCALGYDQQAEGLVGDGWDLNVTRLVARTKLADGFAFNGKTPMTRDAACLLAFNALTVPMVEYEGGVSVTTGDGTKVDVNNTREPSGDFLCENYGLDAADPEHGMKAEELRGFDEDNYADGVITDNSYNAVDGAVTVIDGDDYKVETGEELLGHYVRVYFVGAKVISISEIGSVKEVAAIKKGDTKTFKSTFGTLKKADDIYIFDGADNGIDNTYAISKDSDVPAAIPAGTYVFNDDGELVAEILDYGVVSLDVVGKGSTKAGEETIELERAGKLQNNELKDEVREYDGIAEKDIVLATKIGELTYLTKVETVDGSISKVDKDGNITLDGTVYAKNAGAGIAGTLAAKDAAPATLKAEELKKNTYTLYLDADGAYILCTAKDVAVDPTVVYYVMGAATSKTTLVDGQLITEYYAPLLSVDGEKSSVLIGTSKDAGKTVDGADEVAVGKLVTLEAVAKKDYKKLVEFAADATAKLYATTAPAQTFVAKASIIETAESDKSYVKADTKFIFVDDKGNVEVKTGAVNYELKATATAQVLYTFDNPIDQNVVVKTVFVGAKFAEKITVIDPATVLYLTGAAKSSTTADGLVFTVYDCVKGEKKEITTSVDLEGKTGFFTFTEKDGITTVSDYAIASDSEPTTLLAYDAVYGSKYESSIRFSAIGDKSADLDWTAAKDFDASKAIFVDTRAAKDIADGEAAVTDIATLAKATGIKLDMLFNKDLGISIVFVKKAPAEA